ncbi:amidase [Periconia macrospinosa]|uniref:Amidase n=1 Tax=Periconia macrospinosa TaxID=97972 RepID=A0A2V1DDH6_9PLEO|nr:amidase [Periconia macrospinosa]
MAQPAASWQAISHAKRLARDSKIPTAWRIPRDLYHEKRCVVGIPETCGVLTPDEVDITSNHDATELIEGMKSGLWTCEQVVTAFCKRAAIAQQLVNCLTEICFEEAIERARHLDQQRQSNPGGPLPPLFGMPISLKDSFFIPGLDATTGIVSLANQPSSEHSALVLLLLKLGAVLYCKTNVPQTMMTADSDNNLFGRTLNPHDVTKTAGGSTGGEGALIALRGSILGVGTDIAGSIRIPSVSCGIYGFRPGVGVVPYKGQREIAMPGIEGVKPVSGPMATSARDIHRFLEAVRNAEPWGFDSGVHKFSWMNLDPKPVEHLTIGIVEDDGTHTPHPPVRRGIKVAAEKLRAAGAKVVPIQLPEVDRHIGELYKFFKIGGPEPLFSMIKASGEPLVNSVQMTGLVKDEYVEPPTVQDYFAMFDRRDAAIQQYQDLFQEHELDALLMPGAPHTAPPFDIWSCISYTGLWNYLDSPACIIPVDRVRDVDVQDEIENAKYGLEDKRVYSAYTGPEHYQGLPVTVQLVGNRQEDEALVRVVEVVDAVLRR